MNLQTVVSAHFFKRPYPHPGAPKDSALSNGLIGLFVASFLIVFQPFGIGEWHTNYKLLKLLGFGVISFLVPTLVSLLVCKLHPAAGNDQNWTIGKEILVILTVLCGIAFANLLYGRWLGVAPLSLQAYVLVLVSVLCVGVFPVLFHVTRKQQLLLKRSLLVAEQLNKQLLAQAAKAPLPEAASAANRVVLIAENEKDRLEFPLEQLLYIEAADNYAQVFLYDHKQKREVIRGHLKRLEAQISESAVVRCHRTFIVNLSQVIKVEGNAAGYRLHLRHCERTIPVSRSYIAVLNQRMGL